MVRARADNSEFSFTAAVIGFHVCRRVWLPHLGQRLSAEREHGNTEDRFVIVFKEHSDTRADEGVDDRRIVGHLPREIGLISQLSPQRTQSICFNYTRTSHVQDLFAFHLTPNNRINYFWPFGQLERVLYIVSKRFFLILGYVLSTGLSYRLRLDSLRAKILCVKNYLLHSSQ